jgi:recombinational DNA repair protein (RecF pathway)
VATAEREETGLVLRVEEKGERFRSLAFFSRSQGLFHPLWRKSRRSPGTDLFDTIRARFHAGKQGGVRFFSDYELLARRDGIGKGYDRLRCASRFAEILRRNARHVSDPVSVFELAETFFDAVNRGIELPVSYLKALYALARNEGYPVREDWAAGLEAAGKDALGQILRNPLDRQNTAAREAEELARSLERWLVAAADFFVD